jgi:thymidylate synthase
MSFSHTEAWLQMLEEVMEHGGVTAPRGMPTRELLFTQHTVRDPLSFPLRVVGREFKDVIGVLEGLSLVGEFNVPELFTDRVAKFGKFMDGGVLWGAYGQRAHGSFADVVDLLTRDPDSRQAVVTFYDSKRDLNRDKLDIPCTVSVQFVLRDNRLDIGVTMRSNDLWLGTPYDFVQFSILQASVAQALGVVPGQYHHRVGSLHLYDRDMERVHNVAFEGGAAMPFPLWAGASVGLIQSRARMLALGKLEPVTTFERWASGLLDE